MLEAYEYLWNDDNSNWVLLELGGVCDHSGGKRYSIINLVDQEILIISDNEVFSAVKKRMVDSGAKIVQTSDLTGAVSS
jgi:hypothetical protein